MRRAEQTSQRHTRNAHTPPTESGDGHHPTWPTVAVGIEGVGWWWLAAAGRSGAVKADGDGVQAEADDMQMAEYWRRAVRVQDAWYCGTMNRLWVRRPE